MSARTIAPASKPSASARCCAGESFLTSAGVTPSSPLREGVVRLLPAPPAPVRAAGCRPDWAPGRKRPQRCPEWRGASGCAVLGSAAGGGATVALVGAAAGRPGAGPAADRAEARALAAVPRGATADAVADAGAAGGCVVRGDAAVVRGGGAVMSIGNAAGAGDGFSCAPTSKISPGPGCILVVGERGAAWVNNFESSSSETNRPALADSPRSVNSRC